MPNDKLKKAKAEWKASMKNTEEYDANRRKLISRILTSRTPRWGSIKVGLL